MSSLVFKVTVPFSLNTVPNSDRYVNWHVNGFLARHDEQTMSTAGQIEKKALQRVVKMFRDTLGYGITTR